jgi:hypothetical protein
VVRIHHLVYVHTNKTRKGEAHAMATAKKGGAKKATKKTAKKGGAKKAGAKKR